MTTENLDIPPTNYRGLLGLSPDGVRPMTLDESKVLISLTMMTEEDAAPIEAELAEDIGYQILNKRLEYYGVKVEVRAKLWVSSLCDRPGTVVMWAYTLMLLSRVHTPVSLTDLTSPNTFGFGIPTEESYHARWDSQKRLHAPRGFNDNWLDADDFWKESASSPSPEPPPVTLAESTEPPSTSPAPTAST